MAKVSSLFNPDASDVEIENVLVELNQKGISSSDLLSLSKYVSKLEQSFPVTERVVDICGTGGDGSGTFNISTAAALLSAAAGAKVLKHGNRSASSKVGSADVLEALHFNFQLTEADALKCLKDLNFYFLFAPKFHPKLARFAPIRKKIAKKTIFNLLGPLVNPAHNPCGIVGAASSDDQQLIASVLHQRCNEHSNFHYWVVHSLEGLDEISLCGKTAVIELKSQSKTEWTLDPKQYGFSYCTLEDLQGASDALSNANIIKNIFEGVLKGPKKDVVLLNAAAVLSVYFGKSYEESLKLAQNTLDSGQANRMLQESGYFK